MKSVQNSKTAATRQIGVGGLCSGEASTSDVERSSYIFRLQQHRWQLKRLFRR
jgi:hypothetical protein